MFTNIWTRVKHRGTIKEDDVPVVKTKDKGLGVEQRKTSGITSQSKGPAVCNILALGKTGSGKTSLLNYLYGFTLPVGAGLPKTGKGLHEQVFARNSVIYHVFDTWGIEADSLKEWRKEVLELVTGRNTSAHIDQWFHAVYYCFSANTARIEEAEVSEVIVPLLVMGCKVVIVLTNAEEGYKKAEKIEGMQQYLREELQKRVPFAKMPEIIPVSSVAGENLAGDTMVRFGRQEVLEAARYNLAEDIAVRLPAIYKANFRTKLTAWKERSLLLLANGKISFVLNNNSAKQLIDLINYDLLNTFGAIDADGDRLEQEANSYLLLTEDKKQMDKRWRPAFRRITYVKGYEYSRGLSLNLAKDIATGLVRTSKSIRENLSRKVERTHKELLDSLQG